MDLNSPREFSDEGERELALVEKKLQETHMNHVDLDLNCILVILQSKHFPTGVLKQKENITLEWIFLQHKASK